MRGITPSADIIDRAQGLFARVLDLPGGMRISTIHAFCQSLLRRFPLEAALAPHFRLLEDADGQAELQGAREDAMAAADGAALATIAGLVSDVGFGRLVSELRPKAAALRPLLLLPAPARLPAPATGGRRVRGRCRAGGCRGAVAGRRPARRGGPVEGPRIGQ